MKIEFDPEKRQATLDTRGLDMARAGEVFEGVHVDFPDPRFEDEQRFATFGHLDGRMVFLAWTWRDGRRRVISMRKANDRERRKYEDRLRPRE